MIRLIRNLCCWILFFFILLFYAELTMRIGGERLTALPFFSLSVMFSAALAVGGERVVRREFRAVRANTKNLSSETMRVWNDVLKGEKDNLLIRIIRPRLFLVRSEELNAFAIGFRTVGVTKGIMELSPETQSSIMRYEIGHLFRGQGVLQLIIWFHLKLLSFVWFFLKLFLIMLIIIIAAFMVRGHGILSIIRSVRIGKRPGDMTERVNRWSMRLLETIVEFFDRSLEPDAVSYIVQKGFGRSLIHCFMYSIGIGPHSEKEKIWFVQWKENHPSMEQQIKRLDKENRKRQRLKCTQ